MHDIQMIREDPEAVKTSLARRGLDAPIDQIVELDEKRRSLLTEVETYKAERNTVSKEIGRMKDPGERQEKIDAMRSLGDRIDDLDQQVAAIEENLFRLLSEIPNIPDPSAPDGPDESANVVLKTVGEPETLSFKHFRTGTWAHSWGSWILNAVQKSPGRASTSCAAPVPGCSGRSSAGCLTCTSARATSNTTPLTSYGEKPCSPPGTCPNSPTTSTGMLKRICTWCPPLKCR